MRKKNFKNLYLSVLFLSIFALWTFLLTTIDVKAIGPSGSLVGFSWLNGLFHKTFGVHFNLYFITDWLGIVAVFFMFMFAFLGLFQWIKRKNILKVDKDILLLGGFYIVVFATYVLFEYLVINYRPVLINGYLEASYPSSTTMLVTCVMPTAIMQFNRRIKRKKLKNIASIILTVFIVFMVIGRLISGVHWVSDIIGGLLFSIGVDLAYYAAIE